ncbi:hypothetical protein [Providencia phage PSTCR5]|uniref:Uncharacterized protein n=1 Tax=Providencia phage PSTCR5 TaxID=2783547 RepID=A0A873WQ90_9CAUD|nr:hypothetical protein KNV68_gp067 [Providencia phage PSTCR5]QPB12165.1 hypothetical protein [Providencia phage PSTCR5]
MILFTLWGVIQWATLVYILVTPYVLNAVVAAQLAGV